MSDKDFKLAYNAAQLRVRVEFAARALASLPSFPNDLVAKACARLEVERSKGVVHAVADLGQQFAALWQSLRSMSLQDIPDVRLSVIVAAGIPPLSGVKVVPSRQAGAACVLTIDAPVDQVKSWQFDWLYAFVRRECENLKVAAVPHAAQIAGALLRAMAGEKVSGMVIGVGPSAQSLRAAGKPYALTVNKQRQEITLVVADAKYLSQRGAVEGLVNMCASTVKKLSTPDLEFRFLRGELIERLRMASVGPERFGVALPLVILVGVANTSAKVVPASYPGKGKLQVVIAPDNMAASIDKFDPAWYASEEFAVTGQWIDQELTRLGIHGGRQDNLMLAIEDAIKNKQDLSGMPVVAGDPGQGGLSPYLYKAYKEGIKVTNPDDVLDMREMQQRTLVKTGQMIAEVRFKQVAIPGKDIFGKATPPPPDAVLEVAIGEGVEARGTQYYATIDGIPVVDPESITLSKVFVHKGDVNLRSGNIRFDGNVEITGAIDSGATVEVSGDLIVGGTIRDAFVKVGGDLEARMGIVTGETGRVHVRNNVLADFIENSTVVCGGNMRVKKVLLNSRVVVGGELQASKKNGIVAGGLISVRNFLSTGKLGFPKGGVTTVNVGVDWKIELKIRIRTARLERVTKVNEDDRQTLRELSRRKDNQLAEKHREKMEELKQRITKGRLLVEKLTKALEDARAKLTYDPDAKIFVAETLYANCKLTVGGSPVLVTQDVVAVKVISKKIRGSHILALEDEPAASAAPLPKAG